MMASDELVERAAIAMAARENATSGVTVPWDEFTDQSREEYRTLARTVLAVVEAERPWEYTTTLEGTSEPPAVLKTRKVAESDARIWNQWWQSDPDAKRAVPMRRHPATEWEAVPDGE